MCTLATSYREVVYIFCFIRSYAEIGTPLILNWRSIKNIKSLVWYMFPWWIFTLGRSNLSPSFLPTCNFSLLSDCWPCFQIIDPGLPFMQLQSICLISYELWCTSICLHPKITRKKSSVNIHTESFLEWYLFP